MTEFTENLVKLMNKQVSDVVSCFDKQIAEKMRLEQVALSNPPIKSRFSFINEKDSLE